MSARNVGSKPYFTCKARKILHLNILGTLKEYSGYLPTYQKDLQKQDAYLDEQDLKDIAEAQEDIRQGRVYTTKEVRAILGIEMSYSFFWTDRSRKDLEKLSPTASKRIADKSESLSEDPHRTAQRCEGYPWYHQRVGDYRAILKIDDAEFLVSVLKVGIRRKI